MSDLQATEPRVLAVVPARFASTRFPGKIITPLLGKPLVIHAYERAKQATLVTDVVIATDDRRVIDAVAPYGAHCILTRDDHATGTDRIAEVARGRSETLIVNVQGDEALIDPRTIDATIRPLLEHPELMMSTARHRISAEEALDPNRVKVVCDEAGRALLFSRAPIPHVRDAVDREMAPACYWQHVGLYAYRRDFLLAYAAMPQTPLEKLEKLEQLRVLERGYSIAVVDTAYEGIGVDVPEDLIRVEKLLALEGDR
ncbi:MAG: 3-deoxy-manno-octulosonate cytidylyltransferase [Candidatus Hydrogenedentes bacterium]|nr:3-deoxy-manno-octulosonate cytidylyltransferase [Candidatus Hydrogenedentota bacterium]